MSFDSSVTLLVWYEMCSNLGISWADQFVGSMAVITFMAHYPQQLSPYWVSPGDY